MTATPVDTAGFAAAPIQRRAGALKSVIIWVHLGPYHLARADAASGFLDLTVIELAGAERGCGWGRRRGACPLPVITIGDRVWDRRRALLASFRILRVLSRLNPDVLFIAGYGELPCLAAALWGRLHRRRTVLLSDSTRGDRPRRRYKEALKSLLLRAYGYAIVAGTPQADYLVSLGFERSRTGRPYDVVDNDYFSSRVNLIRKNPDARAGLPQDYFLFVGRLCAQKNLPFLIRSFARYRAGGGAWDLVLVGGGVLAGEVLREAERLEVLDHVHLQGPRFGTDLVAHYAFAACLVLPSISETWGLVVNEAMAAGLPVLVSSRCGCSRDLVSPGVNGFVFDPLAEDSLAAHMRCISDLSPADRRAMGNASLQIVRAYSLDACALELSRIARLSD